MAVENDLGLVIGTRYQLNRGSAVYPHYVLVEVEDGTATLQDIYGSSITVDACNIENWFDKIDEVLDDKT